MASKEKRKSFFSRENSNLSYSKITANPKIVESVFKSELAQILKVSTHKYIFGNISKLIRNLM